MGKNLLDCKQQSINEGDTLADHFQKYHKDDAKKYPKATASLSKGCKIPTDEEMAQFFSDEMEISKFWTTLVE